MTSQFDICLQKFMAAMSALAVRPPAVVGVVCSPEGWREIMAAIPDDKRLESVMLMPGQSLMATSVGVSIYEKVGQKEKFVPFYDRQEMLVYLEENCPAR